MNRLKLSLAKWICPASHRLIEVGDIVRNKNTARGDLIRGGDALSKGWNCHPAILYNGAAVLAELEFGTDKRNKVLSTKAPTAGVKDWHDERFKGVMLFLCAIIVSNFLVSVSLLSGMPQ